MREMAKALINPEVLVWARVRAQLSHDELAARLNVAKPERVAAWESGEERPTFAQARRLAAVLRVPFGYMFLRNVPDAPTTLPDLRTVGRRRSAFSMNLFEVYQDAVRKQAWMREHREARREPVLPYVGSARGASDVAAVADSIRRTLDLSSSLLQSVTTWEQYFSALVDRAEAAGVMVLRSSTVGAATNRPLDVEEFRGFALADAYAPLVFINAADAKAAQIFTLMHELTHIWRAETGISRPDIEKRDPQSEQDVEAFCDAVAAEVLVPADELSDAWNPTAALDREVDRLAKAFRVSAMVIARRAYDLGKVDRGDFDALMSQLFARARALKERQKESSGGPGFLTMVKLRSGALFTGAVVDAVRTGELLYREAASLLGVKPAHLDQLATGKQAG